MGGVYENAPGTQRGNEKVSNLKRRLADTRLEYLAVRELKRIGCGSYVCGEPRAIPIEDIIERGYGISIEYHHLRKNMTTLGQMIFDGGHVPVYDMESQSYTLINVPPNTMLIDIRLTENKRYENRLRFTMAHELAHYILHKSYFTDNEQVPALLFGEENEDDDTIEREANRLSSYYLVATGQMKKAYNRLRAAGHSDNYPRQLGSLFKVSSATMEIRLREHGLI